MGQDQDERDAQGKPHCQLVVFERQDAQCTEVGLDRFGNEDSCLPADEHPEASEVRLLWR